MTISLRKRYDNLAGKRQFVLERARKASALTVPDILPPAHSTEQTELLTPHQSLGARGLANIVGKFLIALFPPGQSFFRLVLSSEDERKLKGLGGDGETALAEIQNQFAQYESDASTEFERSNLRAIMAEVLEHLVAIGNILLYADKKEATTYALDEYVVVRDRMGTVHEIIIKETVGKATLSGDLVALLNNPDADASRGERVNELEEVDIYTGIFLKDGQYVLHKEIAGQLIPGSEITYTEADLPYHALRFRAVSGQSYGRGLCVIHLGDLISVEGYAEAINKLAAAASRVLPLVDPSGITQVEDLNRAKDFEFTPGRAQDVTLLQMDKLHDFRTIYQANEAVEERLSAVFLLNSSVVRDAERVTAEEIRLIAQELESAHGPALTTIGSELQKPLANLLLKRVSGAATIKQINKHATPVLLTGIDALGRSHEMNRLGQFASAGAAFLGPERLMRWWEEEPLLKYLASITGADVKGKLKSADAVQAEDQQAQLAELANRVGPNVVNAASQQALAGAQTEE